MKLRRRQISILLTMLAVMLWIPSILYARFEIGHFGLIHSLPVTFFIALALLTFSSAFLWISRENHGRLLCLQLLLLISALWLIPTVTGGSPPFLNHAYSNLGLVNYIADEGSFSSGGTLWYLSWPGAHILHSMMKVMGAINFEPLLGVFPIFTAFFLLLPLYVLLRSILGKERTNYCWAGLWFFYLAYWVAAVFSGPQSTALLLLLTVLALVINDSLWVGGSRKLALLSVVGVLAAAIVFTHLLTALVLMLMLAAFSVAKRTMKLLPVIALCLVIVVCWDMTGGGGIIKKISSQPIWSPAAESPIPQEESVGTFTISPSNIAETEITQHLRGSESHIAVVWGKILHAAIFAVIGISGALFVLVVRRKYEAMAILVLALATLLLLPISGHYGEELLQRIYLFCLPFMSYFGSMLLDIKGKLVWLILCFLLIITIPSHIISHYGNQSLDYFPDGRIAGQQFFDNTTTHGYVSGARPLGTTNNPLQYQNLDYSKLRWQQGGLDTEAEKEMPWYVAISNRDRAWYEWFWGNDEFIADLENSLDNAVNCSLIYINPVFKLYESDG